MIIASCCNDQNITMQQILQECKLHELNKMSFSKVSGPFQMPSAHLHLYELWSSDWLKEVSVIKNYDSGCMKNIGKQYVLRLQSLFDVGNSTADGRFAVMIRA